MVRRGRQRGSVFITTILVLAVVAALAYALNTQVASLATQAGSGGERMNAQYLAQAGLRHHLWQARLDKGTYIPTVAGTLVNHGKYSSTLVKDPASNFIVNITSTGTTPQGTTVVLARSYTISCTANVKTTLVNVFDNKGNTVNISSNSNTGDTTPSFQIIHDPEKSSIKRALMRFASNSFPITGTTIVGAVLKLDVTEHDPAMNGGQLSANRLLKTFSSDRASWTNANGTTDKWVTPGGDFALANEGTTTIASGVTTYSLDITAIVDGWINGSVPNNGLLIRTNIKGGITTAKLRLNALSPRIEVQHC